MTLIWILVICAALALLWAVLAFNNLVKSKNLMREGWSGIDVQLKRRADVVPRLVETVRGYVEHERNLLERVTELRAEAAKAQGAARRGEVEKQLSQALGQLMIYTENYPQLKASENFLKLQGQLAELEDQIQMSRRYYNGCVRNLNIRIESFPSNLVAALFRFQKGEFFQLEDDAERAAPSVSMEKSS